MEAKGRPDGLYEEVVSEELCNELGSVNEEAKYLEKIDPELAADILTEYAAAIIKRKLQRVKEESKNNIAAQIAVVNQLIDMVADQDSVFANEKVDLSGEQLKAIRQKDMITQLTGTKAKDMVRPITSIADSSLFTGASREPNMSSEINKEIASCDRIDMMVSFIRWSGVRLILEELRKFVDMGKKIRIITTTYMGATELKAIEELSKLPNTEIKVSFDGERTRLHAKVYIFYRESGYSTAYVGSSNLTAPAMTSGCEWNIKITQKELPEVFAKVKASYEGYWNSRDFEFYSDDKREFLQDALSRARNRRVGINETSKTFFLDVHPYPYQQAILERLEAERNVKNSYCNLICAATGTGKTIISAFDYRNQCEKANKRLKLLFVAHRKEILDQSIECFREVLKDANFADAFYGGKEPSQIDFLFASVDILNSRDFTRLPADFYEFIVVDECHHLAAKSYQFLFEHFTPKYFVGLTATPERMDGESILPYFNHRIAAEIRLPEAINRKLLCPFQYFGVADSVDLSTLRWTRGGYDKAELDNVFVFNRSIADERANHIIKSLDRYVSNIDQVKGLVFCVSVEHAKYMAEKFNAAKIPTMYLTGSSSEAERTQTKQKLQNGEIKFICVVDLYNEGVDIKQINTVLFLRPTDSLTVFLQQLGRGLRLADGKDCLTVLDYIGQSNKKYRFETKFAALLQKSNQGMKREMEDEFPHLPRGCYIKLEKKAQQYILDTIKGALSGKAGIVDKIRNFEADTGREFSLNAFLDYYAMEPKMIYSLKVTCTGVLQNNELAGTDLDIYKKFYRISMTDSAEFLSYMITHFSKILEQGYRQFDTKEMYYWKMLYVTFIDQDKRKENYEVIEILHDYWTVNQMYIPELLEMFQYNYDHIDFVERDANLPFVNTLKVYSTYTRAQALSMLDFWGTVSEGVRRIDDKKAICLFVTLNKGNSYYSPTTAYHDYSIDEDHFHWQSQNATTPNSIMGQRFIHNVEQGENILLFVREQKDDNYGSVPFMFLGKANFVSYQGSKPMSIVWKLENKIPAKFLEVTDKLGIG